MREQRQAQLRRARGRRDGAAAPQRPQGLLGSLFGGGQQRGAPKTAAAEPEPVEAQARPATRPSPATSARKRKRRRSGRAPSRRVAGQRPDLTRFSEGLGAVGLRLAGKWNVPVYRATRGRIGGRVGRAPVCS